MSSPRIVLASTLPSHLHILRTAGIEPLTVVPDVNEDSLIVALPDATSVRIAEQLAQAKAHAAAPEYPNGIVIDGDSMLLLDGHLQGKSHIEGKTIERRYQQSGRTTELVTGHCVVTPKSEHIEVAITSLDLAKVLEKGVRAYITAGEPPECAGAFTLKALGGWFVGGISGDPPSVVGPSLPVVRRALYHYGYPVSQFWNRQPTHEQL